MQEESILRGQKIVELIEELHRMPEQKLYQDLQGFDLSIHTFHKNYVALNTILTFLTSDARADTLFAVKNRDKLHAVYRDIVCYIHNYVASAMSLIDHSRNLYKKLYLPKKLFPDYQERVTAEFGKDPLAQFVVCLRQYCQHYKAPNISIQTTFPSGFNARPTRKVRLVLSDLQTFDSWNKGAKEYLKTVKEAVDVHDVVNAYRDKVMVFYQWAETRQNEIHAIDFQRFRAKEAELLLLQLDNHIESYFAFKGNYPMSKHDIFLDVLSSEDFMQLEQTSSPHEQAQVAISLFEKKLALPDELKEKILRLYEE